MGHTLKKIGLKKNWFKQNWFKKIDLKKNIKKKFFNSANLKISRKLMLGPKKFKFKDNEKTSISIFIDFTLLKLISNLFIYKSKEVNTKTICL